MDMGVPGGDVGSSIGKRAQRFSLGCGGSAEAFVVAFAHLAEWPPPSFLHCGNGGVFGPGDSETNQQAVMDW